MADTKHLRAILSFAIQGGQQAKAAFRGLENAAQQSASGIGKLASGMGKLRDSFKNLVGGQQALDVAMGNWIAGNLMKAQAEIIRFAKDSAKAFGQFQDQTAEVFTLMPDMTKGAMASMRADVKAFALDVGRTTKDVVPALYQAISAGVPAENVFDFLKTAHESALGGVTDLETAVDGITSVVNAYGEEVIDATEASDLMFTAVRLGKTTFGELSKSVSGFTPLASALGVAFGDTTAALAAMTSQGTDTATASTQLRGLLQELAQEGTVVNDAFQSVAGMGFADFIAQGNNLADALAVVNQASKETGIPIQDLFGNVRAGLGALQLTGAGMETFAANLKEMEDAAGATAQAATLMGDNMQRSVEKSEAAVENLKITLGEAFAPLVQAMAQGTTEVVVRMQPALQAGSTYTDILDSAGDASIKAARSQKVLTQEFLTWMTAANVSSGFFGKISGLNRDASEQVGKLTQEVARQSDSWEDFEASIAKATGGQGELVQKAGYLRLEMGDLGYAIVGLVSDYEDLIDASSKARDEGQRFGDMQDKDAIMTARAAAALEDEGEVVEKIIPSRKILTAAEKDALQGYQEMRSGLHDLSYTTEEYAQALEDVLGISKEYTLAQADLQAWIEASRPAIEGYKNQILGLLEPLDKARGRAAFEIYVEAKADKKEIEDFNKELDKLPEYHMTKAEMDAQTAIEEAGNLNKELDKIAGFYDASLSSNAEEAKTPIDKLNEELDVFNTAAGAGVWAAEMDTNAMAVKDEQVDPLNEALKKMQEGNPYLYEIEGNAPEVITDVQNLGREIRNIPELYTHTIRTVYETVGTPPSSGGSPDAGMQFGGSLKVPAGYPNDSFLLGLTSGEEVLVTKPGQGMAAPAAPARQGDTYITIYASNEVDVEAALDRWSGKAGIQAEARRKIL